MIKKGISLLLISCLLVISTAVTGLASTARINATGEISEALQQEIEEIFWMEKALDALEGTTGTSTRGAIVAVIYIVAGEPSVNFETVFTDVSNESDYSDAIVWAYKNGIVYGFGDGSFKPYEDITKEQFALMFYRYTRILGYDIIVPDDFPQIPHTSDWAQDAMRWMVYFEWLSHSNPSSPLVIDIPS